MIDHGLLIAATVYTAVLVAAGVAIVLSLAVWAARPPLTEWARHRAATRDLRRTADALQRSSTDDTPRARTPHHAAH
ncbi:hypothetical protein [Cryptosporangium arvum]|uniref:Uncharacterized protein n=1 Tax=Cryptosporangium arvum DSM 44712 TaxID=927661 RepID=A0A010YWW1_9ACTN|nr:hypothetical protein [Cryptosporangium arvum]EXG79648.1 hypothetical protein CryarDRAFT_0689 [Cryptosporangium arvum DSM 44712]